MELREFAERVLFATSLEDKLRGPESPVTDEGPGSAIAIPGAPGRPETLRFIRGGGSPPLPRSGVLEDERQRAVLLHFFANHELLATELMALILLRFPEAPAEFRSGLYDTLREEQRHTTWYLRRLEECGLSFGELPVNRYFWDVVAPVASPLEYVSRLSLTFEQANLDYSVHFAEVFARSGDERSAKILRAICRDEVGHVRYGLEWFRRWRDPALSDWDAYERLLAFPLSPSRAKANGDGRFNREGRLAAGLEPDFVRRLEFFERSRGRTPRVLWFCPEAEESIAGGDSRGSDVVSQSVAGSLELLLLFACRRDDVLLVRRRPTLEELEPLRQAGFTLPELEELAPGGGLRPDSVLRGRKLAELRPWAWCPPAVELLRPLAAGLPDGVAGIEESWTPAIRALHSKSTHQDLLREFLETHDVSGTELGVVGRTVRDVDDLERAAAEMKRAGFQEIALKSPFGAAARGNRRWRGPEDLEWAARVMERQGGLVVEPWLDRVWDFSVQFEMGNDGLKHLDFIRLENNPRGQFQAAASGLRLTRGLPGDLARFLHETVFPVYEGALAAFLESRLRQAGFRGALGIDAFVYRDSERRLRWKPVVELNPRYTMGRIAHEIRRQVAPGCSIRLAVTKLPGVVPPPQIILDSVSGRMEGGQLWLGRGPGFGALLTVGRTLDDIGGGNYLTHINKKP